MKGYQGQGHPRIDPGGDRRKPRPRARQRLRPEILALEDRQLLSTFTVTDPSDSLTNGQPTVNTLRWAVEQADAASTPSTIAFSLGSSPTTITLTNGQLELSNTAAPITIQGPGAGLLAIDGGGTTRIFEVDAMVAASISGLTIQDGLAPRLQAIPATGGGGVVNYGTLSISQVTFSGDVGGEGGALYNSGSASMIDCTVTGTISLNAVIDSGGSATLSIAGSNFTGNTDSAYQVTVINGGSATITGSTFTNNSTDSSADNAVISGDNDNSITLENSTIADNPDAIGLYIELGQELNVVGCRISGNQNGIFAQNASVGGSSTISGCTISDNARYGLLDGPNPVPALVSGCTLQGNGSGRFKPFYGGGALLVNVEMENCTITGNQATYGGGVSMGSNTVLIDCTIAGNVADYGGGVSNASNQGQLIDCTITGNSATSGGGIFNYYYGGATYLTLTNTIVAGNTLLDGTPSDIDGGNPAGVTGTNNLIGTGGSGGLSPSDNLLNVADPGLTPLGYYGGPTETIALQPNSLAIGAGVAVAGVTTDQRGFPLASKPDIGAFQTEPLVVNTTADEIVSPPGVLSLREALNLANVLDGGATITFDPTVFAGATTITLTLGQLDLRNTTGPITIDGPGAGLLAIDGDKASGIFEVDAMVSASISGVTIQNSGTQTYGGGIDNQGTLVLDQDTFLADSAYQGGGLYNGGTVAITGCTFENNYAVNGGGVENLGTATLDDCSFLDNSAYYNGGGMVNFTIATLVDCSFNGNQSDYGDGGGFSGFYEVSDLIGCMFTANVAGLGGALYFGFLGNDGSTVGSQTATNCVFTDNQAGSGGAICVQYSEATITGCVINDNSSIYGPGGGVFLFTGGVTLIDTTVTGNSAVESNPYYAQFLGSGGGLYLEGDASLTDCTISGNSAGYDGGGVFGEYGQLSITDSTIQGNQALYGAGLFNFDDSVTLTGTTVSGNAAISSPSAYDHVTGQGGGVFIGFGGTLAATNSTIADNSAALEGGGIFNQGPANLSLVACTVSGNSAEVSGGGLYNYPYTGSDAYATLTDTIIADNTTPDGPSDITGANADLVTGSFNLIGTGGSGGLSPTDNLLNVANPGLGPLGYYGGPTETIPLLPGSPAIDAGSNALDVDPSGNPLNTDQRGLPRVVSGTVDIGAFESSGFVITVLSGSESTLVGSAFPNPLSVEVTPVHPGDPVAGGVVTFNAPGSGPSATLSADSSTIDASGEASVTASANMQAGSYQVTATASGGSPAEIGLQNVFATVSNFEVAWGADSASLVLQPDGLHLLPSGRSVDIPWSGIRSFTLTFDYPITLTANEVSVTGINVANYGPVTITGSGETYTITLAQPITAADRITLVISNPLLGSYTRELDVLPGDVNDDGVVNAQDIALERDAYVGQPVSYIPLIFEDILGDGSVDLADYNAVRAKSGTKLPPEG
jgi:hypothetical protein